MIGYIAFLGEVGGLTTGATRGLPLRLENGSLWFIRSTCLGCLPPASNSGGPTWARLYCVSQLISETPP